MSSELSAIPQSTSKSCHQMPSYNFICYLMSQEYRSTEKTSVRAAETLFIIGSSADSIQNIEPMGPMLSVYQFIIVSEWSRCLKNKWSIIPSGGGQYSRKHICLQSFSLHLDGWGGKTDTLTARLSKWNHSPGLFLTVRVSEWWRWGNERVMISLELELLWYDVLSHRRLLMWRKQSGGKKYLLARRSTVGSLWRCISAFLCVCACVKCACRCW